MRRTYRKSAPEKSQWSKYQWYLLHWENFWYVFYVDFYVRCDGRTSSEAPTAWNLCHGRHFFHAIGRKKRNRKKKKREKKRKKKGKEKGREKRETQFQASSNSSSRAAKVTDVFRSRCDKKGHFGLQTLLNCFNKINILLAVALKPSIQHLWDLVLFDSSDWKNVSTCIITIMQ